MRRPERKRPAVTGPGANPKALGGAKSDKEIIPTNPSRVKRFRESLALATIHRAPRLANRIDGRKGAAK
jgi:hypothetical protein